MKTYIITTLVVCFNACILFSQDVNTEIFATGFNRPVDIKHANDSRLFVVEQDGIIKILNSDGSVNPISFLDISSLVTTVDFEQGLLGLAFHPNYNTNGYFYVNYTNTSGNTVVSRFTVSATNPDIADATSEVILLTVNQPFDNHNGGCLTIGPDNHLYVAIGDGGSGGDPGNRAQNLMTLLGKVLRLDITSTTTVSIPSDNPFVGDVNALDEIWAYGLRNPWKMSFDRDTNELWIADVGQNSKEEINMVASTASGLNYGWRCYEGNSTFNTSGCPSSSTMTFPVSEYNYGGSPFRCSITGGYRYRGTQYPDFQGLYFFADYCTSEIGTLAFDGSSWNMTMNGPFSGNFVSFGEDVSGELYVAGITNGTIYKIVDTTLSVAENTLDKTITIYPNPTENSFFVKHNPNQEVKSVAIYTINGQLMQTQLINTSKEINISTLKSGMYIVAVTYNETSTTYNKLIVN